MRYAKIAITVVLAFGVVVILAFAALQRSMLYFPTAVDVPPKGRPPFVPWSVDGDYLGYVRDAAAPRRVVVFFHGNGGEALDRDWFGRLVPSPDVVVVLAEYPGYGAKSGELSETAIVGAAKRLVAAVHGRWNVPITLVGESLGTGVACAVAKEPGVDRLALISPYTSILAVASHHYPMLPVKLLLQDTYRSDVFLKDVKVPLHVVHGVDDDIIPFASGKALFESYSGAAKHHTAIPGAAHNDLVSHLLDAPVAEAFRGFVRGD